MSNQPRMFTCSGCGKNLPLSELSIMGPDFLKPKPTSTRWCYKQSCRLKADILSRIIQRKLDITGRKLLQEARDRGDKEGEEIIMALYMVNKMERIA